MKTIVVLAVLIAVAVANPVVNIAVHVNNQDADSDEYVPTPDYPEVPEELKNIPVPLAGAVPAATAAVKPHVTFPGAPPRPGTLVNIEVFVDSQRQGEPDEYEPEPY